jgi:MoxR-like ATPase
MNTDIRALTERVQQESSFVELLNQEVGKVIVGQRYMLERILIGLLCNGHVLLEGVPGLAKTLTVRTIADSISASFMRIQFTPDLLPADLVGTMIYNQQVASFTVRKGPIFANVVLADEINRAPAKVQSALLEVMQEHQVTIGHTTYPVPAPFLVLATQNPIESEGTYALPEAQVDRFMMKVLVGYPTSPEEHAIVGRALGPAGPPQVMLSPADLIRMRGRVEQVYVDPAIVDYAVRLVAATRSPAGVGQGDLDRYVTYGASPRATIALVLGGRALAFLRGREYVLPSDIDEIALDVMRHRIVMSYEALADELDADTILTRVLRAVAVPEVVLQP